jgi:hypothetical protein
MKGFSYINPIVGVFALAAMAVKYPDRTPEYGITTVGKTVERNSVASLPVFIGTVILLVRSKW